MSTSSTPSFFDQELAARYDTRFAILNPLRDALHLLTCGVLAGLPADARVLCVGAGTGAEILALAGRFPGWRFVAVEPSTPMLALCRGKAAEAGIADRCEFHEGYLDSLPETGPFHAATSFLVSHFILDPEQRRDFFKGIASRLAPAGILVSADLSSDEIGERQQRLMEAWRSLFEYTGMGNDDLERLFASYRSDVALSFPRQIEEWMVSAGFGTPVEFFQGFLIRAWFARRANPSISLP